VVDTDELISWPREPPRRPRRLRPRSSTPRPPDRRRHGARLEWLPAHRGVPVWRRLWALDHARGSRAGSTPLRAAEL